MLLTLSIDDSAEGDATTFTHHTTVMSPLLFFLLILATAALGAYTRRFDDATAYWGRRLGSLPSVHEEASRRFHAGLIPTVPTLGGTGSGSQDDIVPMGQNVRSVLFLIGIIAVPALVLGAYSWPIAIGAAALGLLIQLFIGLMLPRPESAYYWRKIRESVECRSSMYKGRADKESQAAADYLIAELKELEPKARSTSLKSPKHPGLIFRLRKVWRFLWTKKWYRFLIGTVAVVCVITAGFYWLPLSEGLRYIGLFLQLAGVYQVSVGLRDTRRLFGMPKLSTEASELLGRLIKVFKLEGDNVCGTVDRVAVASYRAGAGHSGRNATVTIDERVDKLEKLFVDLENKLDSLESRMRDDLLTRLDEERSKRTKEIARIEKLQREFSVGGISLEVVGVGCLAIGIILATIPGEIASLF